MLDHDVGQPASVAGATTLITDLPYGPKAAEVARKAVAVALHGTEAELLDDARLITSELATNAFASGSPPLVLCVDRTTPTTGGLEVEITVTDGGCSHPAPSSSQVPGEEAESGRGLVIVEALADAWSLTTGTHGTRAWCRLTRNARPTTAST
ncbi:ATP-binding protein [Streptomyces sp. NPDC088090]|uniref:ATP-binding protein n=1 Tax=Streptomyces sp. NPDC088090 TaxID=3365822 RepID=UPI003851075B